MELSSGYHQQQQPTPWHYLMVSQINPENYVHWTQTPESYIYSADLSGVRKEEIKVEVEESRYLIIRTQGVDETAEPARRFMRKFRLPSMVDVDGISAGYEDGVLTVTVPRASTSSRRRTLFIQSLNNIPEVTARAA